MTNRELELAATLLEIASLEFANHGCNDFDLPDSWTQEECDDFTLAMETWNGSPEDHEPGLRFSLDWYVMSYLSSKLAKLDGDPPSVEVVTIPKADLERLFSMNAHQHSSVYHPYTCGNKSSHRPLIACYDGWRCADCDYHQQFRDDRPGL